MSIPDQSPVNKSCLSYWLPKLKHAQVAHPRTLMLPVRPGEQFTRQSSPFIKLLHEAAQRIGFPVFLRTGTDTYAQHWSQTCFCTVPDLIPQNVVALSEFAQHVELQSLSSYCWAVQEFLPLIPLAYCPNFSGLPICRAYRCSVVEGNLQCVRPYWTHRALEQSGVENPNALYAELYRNTPQDTVRGLAEAAGKAVVGAWWVNVLETKRGWVVTKMTQSSKVSFEQYERWPKNDRFMNP